ncbi:MAG: response regulator, partial [Candidatus Binatia bacterium]
MAESHGILLVEDDRFQREPLEFLFQLRGYEVIAVGGAAEALEKLRAGFTPCVIVLDLMMPDMSVEDFRREQLNDVGLAKVPIILYSAA